MSEQKIVHLPVHLILKKKWYDLIDSGEKTEEYRDISNYWMTRLLTSRKGVDAATWQWPVGFYAGKFNIVVFQHGYAKNAPRMRFRTTGIRVDEGREEWGAIPGKKYFVIKLGERIA
jgi:hypothetical protein